MFERPNDQRGFIHTRLLGGIGGFFTGGPLGAAAGFAKKPRARPTLPTGRAPALPSEDAKQLGRGAKFGGAEFAGISRAFGRGTRARSLAAAGAEPDCKFPKRFDPRTGMCRVFLGEESGRDRPRDERERARTREVAPVGDAVMGRFGAGLEPGVEVIERSVCLTGMILGEDGLCYNKGQISNTQRMWPRGRRPLLTGGDMRAISIAARAGKKVEATTKRLQGLGMIKKPAPRRALPRHEHAKQIAAVSV